MARLNRDLIEAALSFGQMGGDVGELKLAPAPVPSPLVGEGGPQGRMGGGSGLGNAELRLAEAVGSADPHLPFGHPLPWGEAEGALRVPGFIGPPPLAPPSQGGKVCVRLGLVLEGVLGLRIAQTSNT